AHAGRLAGRFPHRRHGADHAGRAAALRLPPAFRAQGAVFADHGPRAHGCGTAHGAGAAGCGRHRPRAVREDQGMMEDRRATGPGDLAARMRLHTYDSATQWAWGAAVSMASALGRSLEARPRARLL